MNERVPDSTGLPLRAMVMVLLFLGVIFLLLGWQALGSSGSSDDDSSPVATSTTTSAPSSSPATSAAAGKPQIEVHVYNISGQSGVAKHAADQLKSAGFNVADPENMTPPPPDVTATTVYYTDDSDKPAADAVAKELSNAPVEKRIAPLVDKPAGVIVLVTG